VEPVAVAPETVGRGIRTAGLVRLI
jgi:hypothetical protein